MRQPSNMSRQMMTASIMVVATSLSGCASLQGVRGDLKSGSVTTPDEMSKALYLPEPTETYDVLAETEGYTDLAMSTLIMDGQLKPMPLDVELFDSGPSLSECHTALPLHTGIALSGLYIADTDYRHRFGKGRRAYHCLRRRHRTLDCWRYGFRLRRE